MTTCTIGSVWNQNTVATLPLIDVHDVFCERVKFGNHKLSLERLHDDHYARLYHPEKDNSGQIWNPLILLELVEVQLDVVNSVDGAKSFPFDHPQSLHKRRQSWVSPKDPHLFQLLKYVMGGIWYIYGWRYMANKHLRYPEKNSRVCFWVALLHFAMVEQLLLQPLQFDAGQIE